MYIYSYVHLDSLLFFTIVEICSLSSCNSCSNASNLTSDPKLIGSSKSGLLPESLKLQNNSNIAYDNIAIHIHMHARTLILDINYTIS